MLLQEIHFLLNCGPKATLLFLNYIINGGHRNALW